MPRASLDLINSGSRYDFGTSTRRFLITFIIGFNLLFINVYLAAIETERWHILDSQYSEHRLRNNRSYIVESLGAVGVKIGENTLQVRQRLNRPEFRSFERIETWRYNRRFFKADLIFHGGNLKEIRFYPLKDPSPGQKWYTALGINYTDRFSEQTFINDLKEVYRPALVFRHNSYISVPERGIRFQFNENRITRIDVFQPVERRKVRF